MFCTTQGLKSLNLQTNKQPEQKVTAVTPCQICLTDITPAELDNTNLLCTNKSLDLASYPTAPNVVAHGRCVSRLYLDWRQGPSDMRLPNCPRCKKTLAANVTQKYVPVSELLHRYHTNLLRQQLHNNYDETMYEKTVEKSLGEAIVASVRENPDHIATLLTLKNFDIIAKYTVCTDKEVFAAITDYCPKLRFKERLQLLNHFADDSSFNCPAKIPLDYAIINGILSPLPPSDLPELGRGTYLTLAKYTPLTEPTNPVLTALVDMACGDLSLDNLANVYQTLEQEAIDTQSPPYPIQENIQFLGQPPHDELKRASILALGTFNRKLNALQNSPTHIQLTNISTLNTLRKHPCKTIRALSADTWLSLSFQRPTAQACLNALINKLASSKGLNAEDMDTLSRILKQQSLRNNLERLPAFAQAVLAYPRQGQGVRYREILFNPCKTFQHIRLHQHARNAVKHWLKTSEKSTLASNSAANEPEPKDEQPTTEIEDAAAARDYLGKYASPKIKKLIQHNAIT